MKDRFSDKSGDYAAYRPGYPLELFEYLCALPAGHDAVWDCGTGNGQLARELATVFRRVEATDISSAQLSEAVALPNIHYTVQPAEQTDFAASSFDMITVGQAVHWFDLDRFYAEVRRVGKPGGWLVLTGYHLPRISPEVDALVYTFYQGLLGPYWDAERRHVDARYLDLPFPFEEVAVPAFEHRLHWTPEHLIGYLQTWSALKLYRAATGNDPMPALSQSLREAWGPQPERLVAFPTLLRVGRL